MVAPLIVGAARVVGGSSKAQLRAEAASARPELLRRVRARERRKEREETPLDEEERQQQIANSTQMRQGTRLANRLGKKLRGIPSSAKAGIMKIRAISTATTIFWGAITFYVPQITLWIIGIIGLGTESIPFADWLVPGEELYMLSWILITFIGLGTMLYATILFTLRGIKCFDGWKGFIFIICTTGYLVMFINFFPWFIVWIFSVVFLQKEDAE